MICAGIDAGSRAIKIVLVDRASGEVVGSGVADQGIRQSQLASELLERLLAEEDLTPDDIASAVATGYARRAVREAETTITEITCHARGVHHRLPGARTVIEIGGQDSKLLRLDDDGTVRDFVMNDRCAAGTGRFLEMVAARLDVGVAALGDLAGRSQRAAAINSMCVVFAENEITGLLASGVAPEDIVAGVRRAIADRVAGMTAGDVVPPVALTGGVAMVPGIGEALSEALRQPVAVCPEPQMTGALGAALLAAQPR